MLRGLSLLVGRLCFRFPSFSLGVVSPVIGHNGTLKLFCTHYSKFRLMNFFGTCL